MMSEFILQPWQKMFVRSYLEGLARRSILVAGAGSGKTFVAAQLAQRMRQEDRADGMMILTDEKILQEAWPPKEIEAGQIAFEKVLSI